MASAVNHQAVFTEGTHKKMLSQIGSQDMTELQDISNEAIAENLKMRLKAGVIYTNISRVLIAVNPFKTLDIYGPDVLEFFREDGKIDKLGMKGITVPVHRDRISRCCTAKLPAFEPHSKNVENIYKPKATKPSHIYGLTNNMYHNMVVENENQCVIISGESGAGKTVSANHVVNFITKAAGKGSDKVEHIKDIIIQSNHLLGAFGNALTTRNNNSSRFGKFLEIQFNQRNQPGGGKIHTFLLEKSRVVNLARNERNYHVFYQMLCGCSKEEKEHFGLQGMGKDYHYLNQSGVFAIDGKDDNQDYVVMRRAMHVIGLDSIKQRTILRLVSAILHLGNIEFKEKGNMAIPADNKLLEFVAHLLGVNKENLQEKLVSVITETRWGGRVETTKMTNNLDQAMIARDSLAKVLYSHLFDHIVQVINNVMKKEDESLCLGVLDIYGFEMIKENSFEQFVINYVSEKLQQVLLELTLKIEQEEYIREGIPWEAVDYFNNKIVCNLIESKRPPGIMAVLDDACRSMHGGREGSQPTFAEKMRSVTSNQDFGGLLQVHDEYFTIKHYGGNAYDIANPRKMQGECHNEPSKYDLVRHEFTSNSVVDYQTKYFCVKNDDELLNDMITLMQSSDNSFIRDLFPETVYAGGRRGRNEKIHSYCAKIKCQTNSVIGRIMACTPHYVQCIKPSETKAPLDWNQQRVINQIVYLGLKENIKVRKTGYAIRRDFDCIVKRYSMIASETQQNWTGDPADSCRFILKAAGFDSTKWAIGKTKLFLKEPNALYDLENQKNEFLSKYCVIIQKNYRRYKQAKNYRYKKRAALVIQRNYRAYRSKKVFVFRRNSFDRSGTWAHPRLGTFAAIVERTMNLKREAKRPKPESFTTIMTAIFGPSGGVLRCRGIELEIPQGSLTTTTKQVCIQICNCEEDIISVRIRERFMSRLVALGPNREPLTAPAQLYLPLQGCNTAGHELLLRWSPTEVGEVARWRDVLPGACMGQFAGPTVRLQIIGQKVKISTNRFGLFCIIARESDEDKARQNEEGFLFQGIPEIIRLVSQKIKNEVSERLGRGTGDGEKSDKLR